MSRTFFSSVPLPEGHEVRNQSLALEAGRDLVAWADPRDLSETGWAVIFHENEKPEVRNALKTLLSHRQELAKHRYRELVFLESDRKRSGAFFERYHLSQHQVDPDKLPYYLLIIGPPEKIPFEFQYKLDVLHAVGRLSLEDRSSYQAYAENISETELSKFQRSPKMALFGAENDRLTVLSTQKLIQPIQKKLAENSRGWELVAHTGRAATKNRLQELMGGSETPALLLTAGHGTYWSRNAARRIQEQGSLITSDWPGSGSLLERDHYFSPEDIDDDADFRGMISFHFACYTAGTPEYDGFMEPEKTIRLHDYPFVAPLPKRMLGLKRGPLAVIGHVDQAFQYSFFWDDRIGETNHFVSSFYKLMEGYPVGYAMEPFNRRFTVICAEILEAKYKTGLTDGLRILYWIAYHDSRNYIILGDPAVSLARNR